MYSPKIREDLIPRIYAAAQAAGIAMTRWVNEVLERALTDRALRDEPSSDAAPKHAPINPSSSQSKGGYNP